MAKVPLDLFAVMTAMAGKPFTLGGVRFTVGTHPPPAIVTRDGSEVIQFCLKAVRAADGEVLVRPQALQEVHRSDLLPVDALPAERVAMMRDLLRAFVP